MVWLVCHLFGHEALGLLSTRKWNMKDTRYCGCGKREVTNFWVYSKHPV